MLGKINFKKLSKNLLKEARRYFKGYLNTNNILLRYVESDNVMNFQCLRFTVQDLYCMKDGLKENKYGFDLNQEFESFNSNLAGFVILVPSIYKDNPNIAIQELINIINDPFCNMNKFLYNGTELRLLNVYSDKDVTLSIKKIFSFGVFHEIAHMIDYLINSEEQFELPPRLSIFKKESSTYLDRLVKQVEIIESDDYNENTNALLSQIDTNSIPIYKQKLNIIFIHRNYRFLPLESVADKYALIMTKIFILKKF